MSASIQIVIALILYMILFGWIGYRRGTLRELLVFIASVGGYFALQRYQRVVVALFNLGWKFLAFARAGGLSGNDDAFDALRTTPNLIGPDEAPTVVFLVWATVLLLTYVLTELFVPSQRSRRDFIATLLGLANGLFYIGIFLPLLGSLVAPGLTRPTEAIQTQNPAWVLRTAFRVLSENLGAFWGVFESQRSIIVAAVLTLILVAAATTLRSSKAS